MTTIEHINPPGLVCNPAFSQAVRVPAGHDTLYVGGQDGVDGTGAIVGPGLAEQTRQALTNLETCLLAAGATLDDVVAWTILLVDGQSLEEGFQAFQAVYGSRPNPPAITMAFVAGLGVPGALVELDAVAAVPPR